MCMIDHADSCEFVRSKVRTCRKATKCSECGREIAVGERYEYSVGKTDEMFVSRCCEHCMKACEWLHRECGGYVFGGVQDDLVSHWEEEQVRTTELGRLIIGVGRGWRTRKGELMPLPQVAQVVQVARVERNNLEFM